MKQFLIFIGALILTGSGFAQHTDLFKDSLTLGSNSTWIRQNGTSFSTIGGLCVNSAELMFAMDGNFILRECHKGKWKEIKGTWKLDTKSGKHYIDLSADNKSLDQLEVQIVSQGDAWITRLTQFEKANKQVYTYFRKP